MNDKLLLRLLKKNVDYVEHKEIIDAFEKELDKRRRENMESMRPIQQPGETYNWETETVILSADIVTPDKND
ncbi:unnamed protein product [Larinioides sclopetarius]|uniref:Uncharacterized protein n=1 Tax=Larinioides sclopetarius TaxID=280406 RepID=A0AAV2BUS6_9ARAC